MHKVRTAIVTDANNLHVDGKVVVACHVGYRVATAEKYRTIKQYPKMMTLV